MTDPLSPLEHAILEAFHGLYRDRGFPPPEHVAVRRRQNTGAGRYVDLIAKESLDVEDGYLDMGGRYIKMSGIPHGLMAVVAVVAHRLDQLEIAVYGNASWDGEERNWSIEPADD